MGTPFDILLFNSCRVKSATGLARPGAAETNVDLLKPRTAKRAGLDLKKGWKRSYIKQLDLSLGEADTEGLISMSADKVAKTVGSEVLGVCQAGFPAINRGTQGYAKLFCGILNLDYVK